MIKPYFKNESNVTVVEVEDFGVIRLDNLPIEIRKEKKGHYEIGWVLTHKNGEEVHVLSEYGGNSAFDFGGRELAVVREIE